MKLISGYIISSVDLKWEDIKREKIESDSLTALSMFDNYQNSLKNLSADITENLNIRKELSAGDTKKLFEDIVKLNISPDLQIEIYNKRLELQSFRGRQLEPEYTLLQKSLGGNTFSVIKDIGFYTYLIIYTPIKDNDNESLISGVCLTARIIDVKYKLKNVFFPEYGLIYEINKTLKVNSELYAANSLSGYINIDSAKFQDSYALNLTGLDSKNIGKILIPVYDKASHVNSIRLLEIRILSLLVFALSVILAIVVIRVLSVFNTRLIRILLFGLFLSLIRFLWLKFEFPSELINQDLFQPGFFASAVGFGIAKSAGELLVTSVFLLVIGLYSARQCYQILNLDKDTIHMKNKALRIVNLLFLSALFFSLIQVFGIIIKSIIFDSNLKFLDKTQVIPGTGLFAIQLVILIISISYFIFSSSIILLMISQFRSLIHSKRLKRYAIVTLFIVFAVINFLIEKIFSGLEAGEMYRLLIITLIFIFCFYTYRMMMLKRKYILFSIRNFSFLMLMCILAVPPLLLEKIKNQETKYSELIASDISEKEEDKVVFLIADDLTNIAADKSLENSFKDKNKIPKLAFYLWANSKLNTENFRSAVLVLDTAKNIISDFNVNESKFTSDSIASFVRRRFFDRKYNFNVPDREEDTTEFTDTENEDFLTDEENGNEPVFFDNVSVLKNQEDKYIVGIAPVEKLELKNTPFAGVVGYILVVTNTGSKNEEVQSSLRIFGNYSEDNLLNKLISKPVITEFRNGEIINTNDPEVSRNIAKTLIPFREYVKDRQEKKTWRYDVFNNEKYRTYYLLKGKAVNGELAEEGAEAEKIYTVTLKRDDFSLTTFYYLKFILFSLFIYIAFYILFSFMLIRRIRYVKFYFKEKLFVSFFIVSVIPIIVLALYTRNYILFKNDSTLQSQLVSDISSLSENLKSVKFPALNYYKNSDSLIQAQKDILKRSFTPGNKNFNVYIKNQLVSSTNEELYKSDLLDTRLDDEAYFNIVYLKKDLFIKNQDIGGYSYLVGYKPFKDRTGNVTGIISSQLVYRQNEIKEELTETLTFILGIYFIVIIILLLIVSYLTVRISRPLIMLKEATEKLSKGQIGVEIQIQRNDEFGNLIESFNKMTKEIERSEKELKKAEREAAWRDIARRVAHEIKNPLTPMKLSIQYLYSLYGENKKEEFEEALKKTNNLISKEIDKLSRIANEFSDFAKLPRRNYEPINVNQILEEVVSLYQHDPKVEIVIKADESISDINADREELNRVFQNLIKNSIQAIEVTGTIEIVTYQKLDFVYVEMTDNGLGIEPEILEKLFEPNFSTKSRGMGLGLAITKKALDDMKAEIKFLSELKKGTKVILKFKKIEG